MTIIKPTLEEFLNAQDKCKASWKVIKILTSKSISWCSNSLKIKFNDWTKDFILSWTEKILNTTWTWCNEKNYTFFWWQAPKVWDDMYIIWVYGYGLIWKTWIKEYNSNLNLPDCPIFSDNLWWKDFLWADKCRVSWKIENIKRTFTNTCWFNLKIKVKNNNDTYFVWWWEYFSWKDISLCLWAWDWWFQIDSTDWKITTQVNVWDNFYAILDQKDNSILRYGLDQYNADSTIPICTSDSHTENLSMTWWLTQENMKKVMDAVEKQIVKDFPDLNKKTDIINSIWTNTNSTWTSTVVKEKTVAPTKPVVNTKNKIYIPKKIVTTNKDNINTSSSNMINSWIIDKSTQFSSWINMDTNTWIIQEKSTSNSITWSTQEVKKDEIPDINNFAIYWITIFIWIVIYFVYRKLKTK